MRSDSSKLIVGLLLLAPGTLGAEEPHWAWKPITRPAIPKARDESLNQPIDLLIYARLSSAGLAPANRATREQLIRRATFSLTGLPPTPEEIDAFQQDQSADAWKRVIDRLLASPHYGERWGRHWLDLVRYADTNGFEFDEPRPDAWRYRDYVIRSFNDDKPYDRFVLEQLAGDEAYPDDPSARIATGFHLLGADMTDASDALQRRQNTLNDTSDTTALAFLGLTLTCARCHDHKFEPISQKDYFRFQAFFTPVEFRRDISLATRAEREQRAALVREYQALTKPIRDEIASMLDPIRKSLTEAKLAKLSQEAQVAHRTKPEDRNGGQQELVAQTGRFIVVSDAEIRKAMQPTQAKRWDELLAQLKTHDGKKPPNEPVAMGVRDRAGEPAKTFVLERGELSNRGEDVEPGYPAILLPGRKPVPATIDRLADSTGRRTALAQWIVTPDNPLTARVIVNRLWQHHFGRGLVATPSDFGVRGERPSHPELLDWLASELIAGKWSLKQIHRTILLSATYQQSTQAEALTFTRDPDNLLISRMNRLRLDGESIRDSLLAISGQLNRKAGGPGVVTPDITRATGGAKAVSLTKDQNEYTRRSIYLFSRRNLRHPFLSSFDLPDSNLSCPKRERSTTAPQALALLNSELVAKASRALTDRIDQMKLEESKQIETAYRLVLGRRPSERETVRAHEFLKTSPFPELCRALFNLNEFVYLD
jgi:hypothetical protein